MPRVRWRRHGSRAGRRRAGQLRQLRPVPAALPHLPGDGGGGGVATGPHRSHARRAVAGRRGRPRVRVVHGRVRAVPRVRDGMPLGRAVRPADGGHPDHAGRHGAHDAVVAADRPADPRPPWPAPGRLEGAGRGAAGPPRAPAPRPASPPAAAAGAASVGHRRVVVHRLRDGRLAALGPRRRAARAPRRRGRASPCRAGARRAAVPSTSTPGSPTPQPAWPSGSWPPCPATRRSSSTRRAVVPP